MIVQINKPKPVILRWDQIIAGDVFSWGEANFWYVKVTGDCYAGLGSSTGVIPAGELKRCSTLVVASKVEITP